MFEPEKWSPLFEEHAPAREERVDILIELSLRLWPFLLLSLLIGGAAGWYAAARARD